MSVHMSHVGSSAAVASRRSTEHGRMRKNCVRAAVAVRKLLVSEPTKEL